MTFGAKGEVVGDERWARVRTQSILLVITRCVTVVLSLKRMELI